MLVLTGAGAFRRVTTRDVVLPVRLDCTCLLCTLLSLRLALAPGGRSGIVVAAPSAAGGHAVVVGGVRAVRDRLFAVSTRQVFPAFRAVGAARRGSALLALLCFLFFTLPPLVAGRCFLIPRK